MKQRFLAQSAGVRLISKVSGSECLVSLESCFGLPIRRNFVLVGFKTSRFADIPLDMELNALESADMALLQFAGLNEIQSQQLPVGCKRVLNTAQKCAKQVRPHRESNNSATV